MLVFRFLLSLTAFIFVLASTLMALNLSAQWAMAAPHPAKAHHLAGVKKLNRYIKDGVFVGGDTGLGFSLLNIRKNYSAKNKIERWVFDIGDVKGVPTKGQVAYFNISIDSAEKQISIDLSQLQKSQLTPQILKKLSQSSPFIKSAIMRFDPEDLSTNILLTFKGAIQAEVFQLKTKNQAGRIVLDLKPVAEVKRKVHVK